MGPCSADAISRVCVAPCDLVVDGSRGQSFFFDGKRVTKLKEFSLSEYRGDVVARVRPGRPGLLGGGIAVMSLGVAGLSGSAFLFLKERSKVLDHKYDDPDQPMMFAGPNYAPATALLISGALVLAGGLAMALPVGCVGRVGRLRRARRVGVHGSRGRWSAEADVHEPRGRARQQRVGVHGSRGRWSRGGRRARESRGRARQRRRVGVPGSRGSWSRGGRRARESCRRAWHRRGSECTGVVDACGRSACTRVVDAGAAEVGVHASPVDARGSGGGESWTLEPRRSAAAPVHGPRARRPRGRVGSVGSVGSGRSGRTRAVVFSVHDFRARRGGAVAGMMSPATATSDGRARQSSTSTGGRLAWLPELPVWPAHAR
jgi:hypothetical protein